MQLGYFGGQKSNKHYKPFCLKKIPAIKYVSVKWCIYWCTFLKCHHFVIFWDIFILCHSSSHHRGELVLNTYCYWAEWSQLFELRLSPQASHFLRWYLSCASTYLPVLAKGDKYAPQEKQCRENTSRAPYFSYVSISARTLWPLTLEMSNIYWCSFDPRLPTATWYFLSLHSLKGKWH